MRCDLLGRTPLWMAARLGAPILLETLLKSPKAIGALNKPDKSGWTPIMVSANRNHQNPTIPKLLIAKGAKLKYTDKDGRYVSHIAAAAGDHIALAEIIKSAPDLAYVRDSRQCTPLHLASERGQHACCSILLKTESAKKGNFCRSIIIFFLPSPQNYWSHLFCYKINNHFLGVNMKNNKQRTALWLASERGDAQIVGLLLRNEANSNLKDKQGWNALRAAVYACVSF